jgi:hypothetical protein
LIEAANTHYSQGRRGLLLDLRQTSQIELSGLFALLNIARLYSGESLLDPEEGWEDCALPPTVSPRRWVNGLSCWRPRRRLRLRWSEPASADFSLAIPIWIGP